MSELDLKEQLMISISMAIDSVLVPEEEDPLSEGINRDFLDRLISQHAARGNKFKVKKKFLELLAQELGE